MVTAHLLQSDINLITSSPKIVILRLLSNILESRSPDPARRSKSGQRE